ncbi:MAG: regulatory protein RecX [Myxococcota bacterium]
MRRISEQSLSNAALHYLRRYSASRKGLASVLERKVKRHVREKGGDLEAARPLIAQVVERMVRAGYVDDARLAESKSASLHRQGKSVRVIRLKLKQKGLEPEVIAQSTVTTPERELEAASTLVRKKRLGKDPERRQRDLGVLLRAGFGYDVAKRALQAA